MGELTVEVFLDREACVVVFGGTGGVSGLGVMLLVDLLKGITGGGFVTKLSALMRPELVRFLATGLLSSSLLTLSSNLYETFRLTLRGSLFLRSGLGLTLDFVL